MSILVRKNGDNWEEWHDTLIVTQMQSTYTAVYGDGRSEEMSCDPYPVEIQMNGSSVRGFYDNGIWSLDEVEAVGGRIAVPFEVPAGKRTVGNPTYAEDGDDIVQTYAVEDIPPPPPPLTPEQKFQEMLDGYGLTVDEVKVVLGID